MTSGTMSLTIPKLKNIEEGLVSPHRLATTPITPNQAATSKRSMTYAFTHMRDFLLLLLLLLLLFE